MRANFMNICLDNKKIKNMIAKKENIRKRDIKPNKLSRSRIFSTAKPINIYTKSITR